MAIHMPNILDEMQRLHLEPNENTINFDDIDPEPDPVFYDALPHIFLPKQVPSQQQHNLEQIDQFLLQAFTKSIKEIKTEVPFSQLDSIELMLEKWKTLQPTSWNCSRFLTNFSKEMGDIQEGNIIPIYVRNQNSTLLIKKHLDKSTSLSTFRSSLPSEMVMSNVSGSHCMEIPETMEIIQNTDMLKSLSFANQLHELTTGDVDISLGKLSKGGNEYTATRDVADPRLVSDWIVGLLVPQTLSLQISTVKKKFRDQVSLNETKGSANFLPFRRSGMYMALKATVQLKLLENMGSNEQGKLVYKIIMLRILTDIASQLPIKDSVSIDLASQMLANIGRRVQKLDSFCNEMDTSPETPLSDLVIVMTLKSKCLENVASTVDQLTNNMKQIWDQISRSPEESLMKLPCQHDDNELYHKIPKLDNFIGKLRHSGSSPLSINLALNGCPQSEVFQRYITVDTILASGTSLLPTSSTFYVWLYDTENFIKYHCNYENITSAMIFNILSIYFEKATTYYENDPLGKSQIYLVSLKGLEILDKITTAAFPLLFDYKPELNVKLFDPLLLPFKKDMDLLDDLLFYFKSRADNARLPGILNSNSVKNTTFSVCYASGCQEMIDLRNRILTQTQVAINQKYDEINRTIELCEGLQLDLDTLQIVECTCKEERQRYRANARKKWKYRWVTIPCEKCKLEENLAKCRKLVKRYEKPLPLDDHMQWAVIFEYLIPQQFAIFRDYLAHVKYMIWGDKIFNCEFNHSNKLWVDYSGMASYKTINAKYPKNIQLSSPTMASSATYHTRTGPLDVFDDEHEDFIISNGLGCTYYFAKKQESNKSSVITDCSFKLKTTSNPGAYVWSNLQSSLESTDHTQNRILTRQNECRQELGLQEFIAFGSLRAGHCIQLRNLYEAIFSGSLSLEHESVLALILQTIWQLGPRNDGTKERESHLDFSGKETQFAEEFLQMLNKLVKTNEANYSNSLILLVAGAITRRIAVLNEALQNKCYGFLKIWRTIMSTWIAKIQATLDKPEIASLHGGVVSLSKNLLEIILCSMLSYSVASKEEVSTVMKDQDDLVHWLETLYHWSHLEDQPVPASIFLKVLQNFVKTIPVRLNLESQISSGNALIINSLKTFITQRWSKATECAFNKMSTPYKTKNKESLVLVEYLETDQETGERITHQITFDFIRGKFLVNGYCQSTLPLEVKDHKLFRMYFGDATNLRIQRDNARLTRTVVPFHERHYEFHQTVETLLIKEIQDDDSTTKLVLMDPEIFMDVLSAYFIKNFTHWLGGTSNQIEYEKKSFLVAGCH